MQPLEESMSCFFLFDGIVMSEYLFVEYLSAGLKVEPLRIPWKLDWLVKAVGTASAQGWATSEFGGEL
jgi:hypothetical protein